jgi:hypothetical protein
MKAKYLLILLQFLSISLFSHTLDSILVGTYLNSSPNINLTYYNFSVVKPLGFNILIQRAIVPINGVQTSNFDSLLQFPNIIAGNDSARDSISFPDNIDWVYYFTNALYSKWSPISTTIPNLSSSTGLKQLFGSVAGDGAYSDTNSSNVGKTFIDGPNYSQYQSYIYTNKYNENSIINYHVNFRLKKGRTIGTGSNICSLQVVKCTPLDTVILCSSLISADMLTNEYKVFKLSYSYGATQNISLGRGDRMLPPTTIPPKEDITDSYFDINTKIQFKVKWLGNAEIALDYIEVYDQKLWEGFFLDEIAQRDSLLIKYLSKFSDLHPNLKYFITLDEPHSFDSYHPIKTVQHLLDSLNSPVKLITHFYPGWNNERESENALSSWYNYVKPYRLMYWNCTISWERKLKSY